MYEIIVGIFLTLWLFGTAYLGVKCYNLEQELKKKKHVSNKADNVS